MDLRARLIGYPRIGPRRELKWTLEKAWSGRMETDALLSRVGELRHEHLAEQREAIGSAVDDYFLYDAVLETAMMLGLVPGADESRMTHDPFGELTALARGTPEREAWEMTKWFDTNYHYVVPEIERIPEALRPLPWREPTGEPDTTWTVIGPYSLVKLSKLAPGLDAAQVARAAGAAVWDWVRRHPDMRLQLDEPCLGMELDDSEVALRDAAYADAADLGLPAAPIVTVQFGRASAETVETLGRIGL